MTKFVGQYGLLVFPAFLLIIRTFGDEPSGIRVHLGSAEVAIGLNLLVKGVLGCRTMYQVNIWIFF